MARVLVIEDDPSTRTALVAALEYEGHQVAAYEHGAALEKDVALNLVDVAIVDVGLPDGPDGIELAHVLSGGHDIPVIVLSARDGLETKGAGYRAGADLYVTKPFSVTELLWQLGALLRRKAPGRRLAVAGRLTLDLDQRIALYGQVELVLTPTEFDLLAALARYNRQVVSKPRLIALVWGHGGYDTNVVETTIRRLRGKLVDHGPDLIETVRGVGYRLNG